MSEPVSIPQELRAWIAEVTSAKEVRLTQVEGGASREAWLVDAVYDDRTDPLFLRFDRRQPVPGSAFHPLAIEAEIMAALASSGLTVPQVVAVHPTTQAVLLERAYGQTWFRLIADEEEQVRVASDFIEHLARVHALDARELDVPSLGPVRSIREHVLEEIAAMRARVARGTRHDALLDICLDWLERNIPAYDGPAVMVQGDTGPGNFMFDKGRVTAVVDWELAHFGDPMDDIAWMSLRAVQDTFTDFPARLAEYAAHSGNPIDESRVWYYRLFAETRMATFHNTSLGARIALSKGSLDSGNSLIYRMLHRRLLIDALAEVMGLQLPAVELADESPTASAYQQLYDACLDTLGAIAGNVPDPLVTRRAKGVARMVKVLNNVAVRGDAIDQRELSEIESLLGSSFSDVPAARSALDESVAAGRLSPTAYVQQAARAVQYDDQLLRPASGALSRRTWPPLS